MRAGQRGQGQHARVLIPPESGGVSTFEEAEQAAPARAVLAVHGAVRVVVLPVGAVELDARVAGGAPAREAHGPVEAVSSVDQHDVGGVVARVAVVVNNVNVDLEEERRVHDDEVEGVHDVVEK